VDDEAGLYRTILAYPDDTAPRLVYADYIEERGRVERAEFIRIQCELAETPPDTLRHAELRRREHVLLRNHQVEWRNHLPEPPGLHWGVYERGFTAAVRFDDPLLFSEYSARIFDLAPIQRLSLHRVGPSNIPLLTDVEPMRRIRTLDLDDGNRIGNRGLELLSNSPNLSGLTSLKLRRNTLGPSGIRALAESPYLGELQQLNLDNNDVYNEGAMYLFQGGLPHLNWLSLGWCRLGDSGLTRLAESHSLNDLEWLYLAYNDINDEGAIALAGSVGLRRITGLHLEYNSINDAGAIALANSPILSEVVWLYLKHNRIGDAGANALADSPYLQSVRELVLNENRIGNQAQQRLRTRFGNRVWL
jgi:uncharacterized protein (TIGR02996 family)